MISSRPSTSHQPPQQHASGLLPSALPLISSPGRDRERSKPSTSAAGGGLTYRKPPNLGLGPLKGDVFTPGSSVNARALKGSGSGLFDVDRTSRQSGPSQPSIQSVRGLEEALRLKRKASGLRDAIPTKASLEDVFSNTSTRKPATLTSRAPNTSHPTPFRIPAPPGDLSQSKFQHPSAFSKLGDPNPASKRRRLDVAPAGGSVEMKKPAAAAAAMLEWMDKYAKAMPKFNFYFDGDVPSAAKKKAEEMIKESGASIDQFFSRKVTHLITFRPSPLEKQKEASARPSPATKVKGSTLKDSVLSSKDVNSPKKAMQADTPLKLALAKGSLSDVVQLALGMNIKIWSADKLIGILEKLSSSRTQLPAPAAPKNQSLSSLLEYERVHGTRERDLSAPRPDYYYFPAGQGYLLMPDALEDHRHIMVKEYPRVAPGGDTPWPVLFSTFMKPSESAKLCEVKLQDRRKKAWEEYVGDDEGDTSRRSVGKESRKQITAKALDKIQQDLRMPYQAASGNSQILTSNIASTSNAGVMSGGTPNGYAGAAAIASGRGRNKDLMQINKRVQVLKGNLKWNNMGPPKPDPGRFGWGKGAIMANPESLDSGAGDKMDVDQDVELEIVGEPITADEDEDMEDDDDDDDDVPLSAAAEPSTHLTAESLQLIRSNSNNSTTSSTSSATKSMAELHRERVLDIIRQAKFRDVTPPKVKKIYKAAQEGFKVELVPPEETVKKPGYCENCKVKFDDFDSHIIGRRHKRFSTEPSNFLALDSIIDRLARPLLIDKIQPRSPVEEEGPFVPIDEGGMGLDQEHFFADGDFVAPPGWAEEGMEVELKEEREMEERGMGEEGEGGAEEKAVAMEE